MHPSSQALQPFLFQRLAGQAKALALLTALILPGLSGRANAQAADAAPAAGEAAASQEEAEPAPTVESVDAKLRILERKLELKEEDEAKAKGENATVTAGKDGFSLVSADKESTLKFRFFQHIDGRYFFEDGAAKLPNTLLVRRVRPVWKGNVGKVYNFRVMPEFSGTFAILDAYSELAFWPEARLRVGKSKTPFGLERLKSSQDMDLIEFSHTTSLTPNYELGISLLGDLWEESVGYSVGVFNGAVDGTTRDLDINDDKDVIGRVFALPFKSGAIEPLRGLGVGFAASWGHKEGDFANPDLPVYRTEGQQSFFAYRTVADRASAVTYNATTKVVGASAAVVGDTGTVRAFGDGYRLNPQGYWYYGPFGLFGEFVLSSQEYAKGGNLAAPETFASTAWQVTANYVVTGESPSFKGLKPRHPVSFTAESGQRGYGALELVGRASQLKVDEAAFPVFANPATAAKQATTYTAGFNWYLSRYLKWSADYAWTEFQGGAPGNADRPEEKVFFSRIQTSF
jgi:phosphate-selective porin OprO/OprP